MKGLALLLSALAICTAITLYIGHLDERANRVAVAHENTEATIDAQFRNAVIHTTDEKGKPLYLTHSPLIAHYTDKHLEITNPVIVVNQKDEAPWRIAADTATIDNRLKKAVLHGTVYADREASQQNQASHLSSEDVTIDYQKKFAHSDAYTVIKNDGQQTEGLGVEIWFEEPAKIRLLSNVRSTFIQ